MKTITVALGQMRCVDSDVEGNLGRIQAMVAEAAGKGAAMVLFPETVDFGWVNPVAHERAGPIPNDFSRRVAEFAREHDIWIGVSLCEKEGSALYDSAVLLDPNGEIVLKHRKINLLAWLMDPPYTPGNPDDIRAVPTPLGKAGMLICADSFVDEYLERLAAQKPDFVYIPYGWAKEKEHWPEHGFQLLRTVEHAARAIGAPVLGPNLVGEITCGEWTGRTYEGLSTAADGSGLSLVQGKWNKPELILLDIPAGR
jgi:predicted amidohydrolase